MSGNNKPYLPFMEFGAISTSNKNTPSDYCLEQKENKENLEWRLNPHGAGGVRKKEDEEHCCSLKTLRVFL